MFAAGCSPSNGNVPSVQNEYATSVSFGSVCCGPVSDAFLRSFLKQYNSKEGTKITADIAAGCGREGEFSVLFKLDTQNTKHKDFITQLQKLVADVDAKNKAANNSSGTLEIRNDVKAADFEYCRLGIKPWL